MKSDLCLIITLALQWCAGLVQSLIFKRLMANFGVFATYRRYDLSSL